MDKIALDNSDRRVVWRLSLVLLLGGILTLDGAVVAYFGALASGWELAAGILGYTLVATGLLVTALILG